MDAGPYFDKTYSRPPDRWPLEEIVPPPGSGRFTKTYSGIIWNVNHNLHAFSVVADLWVDPTLTPDAQYLSIEQMDQNNIRITFDRTAYGRACVYRCLDSDPQSRIYEQIVDADYWEFDHDLGTDALIVDAWVEGRKVEYHRISVSTEKVMCTFDEPCKGIVCLLLADPAINPEFVINWNQITGKPDRYAPQQHTHPDTGDVLMSQDSLMLGGLGAEYYLTESEIGDTLVPLDGDKKIPWEYLPDAGKIRISNRSGSPNRIYKSIIVEDTLTPLRLEEDPVNLIAFLRMRAVVQKLRLSGNVFVTPGVQPVVQAADNFELGLRIGQNMLARVVDLHTVELSAPDLGSNVFIKDGSLRPGEVWTVTNQIFNNPGSQLIQLFERLEGGQEFTRYTDHIVGQYNIDDVFKRYGSDDVLSINDSTLQSKLRVDGDHYWWEETLSTSIPFAPWANVLGVFWDQTQNSYIIEDTDGLEYRFFRFDVQTAATTLLRADRMEDLSPLLDLMFGTVFVLQSDLAGEIILRRTPFLDLPSHTWTDMATLMGATYPTDTTPGNVRFKFDGRYAYLFKAEDMTFTVWDVTNPGIPVHQSILSEKPLDFVVWPDQYVSYCYGTYTGTAKVSFMTSTGPMTDPATTFSYSNIELMSGPALMLGMQNDGTNAITGLAILDTGHYIYAKRVFQNQQYVYNTGSSNYWLNPAHGLAITPDIAYAYNFVTQLLKMDPTKVRVRVAFSLIPGTDHPANLLVWTGTGWDSYPYSDFPARAQDLSVFQSIRLYGGETLYYMLFVEILDQYYLFEFSQVFEYIIREQGMYAPIQMNSTHFPDSTINVKLPVGSAVVTNRLDRDILDLKMVVFGGSGV